MLCVTCTDSQNSVHALDVYCGPWSEYNSTVVAHFMVCKEQIGKICAPFPVDFVCVKILIQFIIEYLMWFSVLIFRLLGTDDGTESKFCIHIFMNRNGTVKIAFAFQIDFHTPISVHSIVSVINLLDLCLYFCFLGIVIRLPVFQVVIVCVWTDCKPAKQPA